MKKAVIFDMDGVLFDSEKEYMSETMAFFAQYGISITKEQFKEVVGVSSQVYDDTLYTWWQNKTDRNTFQTTIDAYYRNCQRDFKKLLKPGVLDTLKYLKQHDYKVAIASSSSKQLIIEATSQAAILQYFDHIVSGEQFKESKPHPEIYLYTTKLLNMEKENIIVIEDSYHGILSAKNAGLEVIAIKDDMFSMDQRKADKIVSSMEDVWGLLKQHKI